MNYNKKKELYEDFLGEFLMEANCEGLNQFPSHDFYILFCINPPVYPLLICMFFGFNIVN